MLPAIRAHDSKKPARQGVIYLPVLPLDYTKGRIQSQGRFKMKETTKRTRPQEEITADIIAYFENNEDLFNDCMEELDSYNGYLGDDRYFSMDELDELYNGTEPSELLRRAFYGYDEQTYTTDGSGNKIYGAFNPNRDYFRYNGYGNLVSVDYKDYSHLLDGYAVEAMNENRNYIDSIDNDEELTALFDELEAATEEE
jgi:hypothetical protein